MVKRTRVELTLVEVTGGVAPATRADVRHLARRARKRGARDGTKYGKTRISTRSYYTHHMQRLSRSAVLYDAKMIRDGVVLTKQRACGA